MDLVGCRDGRWWRAAVLSGAVLALFGCGGRSSQVLNDEPKTASGGSAGYSDAGLGLGSLLAGAGGGPLTSSGAGGVSHETGGGNSSLGGAGSIGVAGEAATAVRVTDVASLSAACDRSLIHPGPSPLRRLTPLEYDNTVHDLSGLAASPSSGLPFSRAFPPMTLTSTFSNDARNETSNPQALEEAQEKAALEIAATVAAAENRAAAGCATDAAASITCARAFISSFGKRAFRRPLTSRELNEYEGLFTGASSAATYQDRIAQVVSAMLQSPNFLVRVEVGVPGPGAQVIALTPYELATRLSYFLWGSMPDAELFAAADANALSTVEQLTAQAQRMLQTPAAHRAASEFHREWLAWDRVADQMKPNSLFPSWTPKLAADLVTEALTFGDQVFWNDGRLATLLTASYSFMNGRLASHYGLPAIGDNSFVKVNLDPNQRSGILTLGAFLAAAAGGTLSNPVARGAYIRTHLLCSPVPPEPPGLLIDPPLTLPAGATTRQRYEATESAPVCSSCHRLIDPLGFALENFDAVGQWRATDGDASVDASGTIVGAVDPATNGPFNGPVELGRKLASSGDVRACVAAQWFRWANGRMETFPDDACSLLAINQRFQNAGYDMSVLPLAIITTDAFRYRSVGSE